MKSSMKGCAILLVALAGVGCLFRSPGVKFYTLSPVEGFVEKGAQNLAVQVGPVVLPRYLSRPQVVTRDGDNEVKIDEYSRWAGGLEYVILNALATDLSQRLATGRIALSTSEAPFPIAYSVTLEFNDLVRREDRLIMDVRWTIDDSEGENIVVETTAIGVDAGKKINGTIRAHEEALGKLADAIAKTIASTERAKTATGQYGAPIEATP